ncbi:MAG: hypothetical protein KAH14_03170, partial [Clostridiales bacterium]|nr:hypothetical protein [Clostridiales bacterium]
MTSQESSNRSVIRHGFKTAFRRNFLVTILASILLAVAMGIPAIRYFMLPFEDISKGCIFAEENFSILYIIGAAVIGLIQALVSFNFIYNRSAVNTYFSIGIKRSQLFNTRILAGAFHTFLSILLPIAVVTEINLIYSTSVNLILGHAVLLLLGMFTTAFIAFSITVIICSSTYTRVESITYSLLANLLPTLILTGLNGFMSAFLWGNTYLGGMRWYHEYYNSLLIRFTEINPLLFLKEYFSELVVQRAPGTDIFNAVPMFLHVVLMLVAAGILIYFSKKIFIKRNIENTKIIGTSNAIAYIVISPAIFVGFSAFLYFTRTGYGQIPITTALLLGAALSAVVFSVLVFPLRVTGKKILNKLLFYLFNLVMCFIIMGIMVSGGLGYVNHMPKNENIESLEISYRGIPDMILTDGMSSGTGAYLFENNGVIKLTNPEDINLAMILHEKFATQGWISKSQKSNNDPEETAIKNMVQVFYNLKNGTKVQRLYPITTIGLMKEMLVLDETETVKE